VSLALIQDDPENMPRKSTLWYLDDADIFCGDEACWYVFKETNTATLKNPDAMPVIAFTDRRVNVSAQCTSHRVVQGGGGLDTSIIILGGDEDGSSSHRLNVSLPVQAGAEQSTFMTRVEDPADCGETCGVVTVFEGSNADDAWYYNCTNTFGVVLGAALPEHQMSSGLARTAAAAIALLGYSLGTDASGAVQSVIYPAVTYFGTPCHGDSLCMERLLMRFAIGVVAIVADTGRSVVTLHGLAPDIGQQLTVQYWGMIHLIFILTAGLQLALGVAVVWITRDLVIPPSGPVAEGQVLRPMMAHAARSIGGDDDHQTGSSQTREKCLWIYRAKYVGGGWYDLYMEADKSTEASAQQRNTSCEKSVGESTGISSNKAVSVSIES
jgi:hypothetical protein